MRSILENIGLTHQHYTLAQPGIEDVLRWGRFCYNRPDSEEDEAA